MPTGSHKRQVFLFAIAILLPAAALITLGWRILHQESELSAKRAADQRRSALDQLRRELAARLETIKLQEINRLIRSSGKQSTLGSDNPAVVFVAKIEADSLLLPWDAATVSPPAVSEPFGQLRQQGELAEFGKKDMPAAAKAYDKALEAARQPAERAEARLLLARTLAKTGSPGESMRHYRWLLDESGDTADEAGIPFRFYAAERLMEAGRDKEAVERFLIDEVSRGRWLALPQMYMLRSLLASAGGARMEQAQATVSDRIVQIEQARAIEKDLPRLRGQIDAGAAWIPYGSRPWLITVAPPAAPLPALLIAVRMEQAAPPGVPLTLTGRNVEGDVLGETFPGLRVQWPPEWFPPSTAGASSGPLYVAGLGLVLGLTILGGYLLLRDVNRDLRMTEVRSQFVASVSHELKTPLTAIRMFAETLALGRSRDERAKSEYLETIVNESERLARLVDNVLDFSKIEQGKKIYRLRPTQLADVADSAVRAMQYPLAQQGFTLNLSVQDEMPALKADPDAIQQAILNLLTNAMKYSGDSREIDLRLASHNGDAVIQVTDRGLGIPQEEQKRVFEKFYRVRAHESLLIAGTGLGLTLVAHIVEAHGGRIELQSEPGAGSTFSILIPTEATA